MEKDIINISILLFLGAFVGTFYFTALIVSCGSIYLKITDETNSDKVLSLLVSFLTPAPYMIGLGVYGFYALIVGQINYWFAVGCLMPSLPVLFHTIKKEKST